MTRDELLNLLHTENLLKFSEAAMSLYAENERLRAALEEACNAYEVDMESEYEGTVHMAGVRALLRRWRSALRATPAGEGRE